jgi:hypothetical protein
VTAQLPGLNVDPGLKVGIDPGVNTGVDLGIDSGVVGRPAQDEQFRVGAVLRIASG